MFDIYSIKRSLNENAQIILDIEPHEFYGELNESHFNQFNQFLSESAFAILSNSNVGNDLLIEGVINESASLEILNESVFNNVIEHIVKFFKGIKSFVMGIIEKIKLKVLSMGKNTSLWATRIKPKLEANSSAAGEFTFESYRWTGIDDIAKLLEKAKTIQETTQLKNVGDLGNKIKSTVDTLNATYAKGFDSQTDVNSSNNLLRNLIKNISPEFELSDYRKGELDIKEYKQSRSEYIEKSIEKAIGCKMSEMKTIYTEQIKGKEKLDNTKFSDTGAKSWDGMLDRVKNCTTNLEAIEKSYNALNNGLTNTIKTIDRCKLNTDKSSNIENLDNRSSFTQITSDISQVISYETSILNELIQAVNQVKSLALTLTEDSSKEFMNILTKFASYKKKKN